MPLPSTLFIPLGYGSAWHNEELRYALRSWSMYSSVPRVVVIGKAPEWFNGQAVPWPNQYSKTEDIWRKTELACELINEPFIFANDDHILTAPITELPYYHAGPISRFKGGSETFMRYVSNTARMFPDGLYYDVHTPMIIDPVQFRRLSYTRDTILKSVYCNSYDMPGTRIVDPHIREHVRYDDIERYLQLGMFSFNDAGLSNDLKRWMRQRFEEAGKWER